MVQKLGRGFETGKIGLGTRMVQKLGRGFETRKIGLGVTGKCEISARTRAWNRQPFGQCGFPWCEGRILGGRRARPDESSTEGADGLTALTGLPVVIMQEPAEALAAPQLTCALSDDFARFDEAVAQ